MSYHHKLMNLNSIQTHFIEIWRSYTGFIKQKRSERPQINEKGIIKASIEYNQQTIFEWLITSYYNQ